jgi:hypothetical protein
MNRPEVAGKPHFQRLFDHCDAERAAADHRD